MHRPVCQRDTGQINVCLYTRTSLMSWGCLSPSLLNIRARDDLMQIQLLLLLLFIAGIATNFYSSNLLREQSFLGQSQNAALQVYHHCCVILEINRVHLLVVQRTALSFIFFLLYSWTCRLWRCLLRCELWQRHPCSPTHSLNSNLSACQKFGPRTLNPLWIGSRLDLLTYLSNFTTHLLHTSHTSSNSFSMDEL